MSARLHAIGAEIEQLHLVGTEMCVHLTDAATRRRASSVLDRLIDISVVPDPPPGCPGPSPTRPWLRTTYVVQAEKLAPV